MERMALGLFKLFPKWTILVGDAGTGKTTLIRIIWRMFYEDEHIIGVSSRNPMNFGQYNDESLGICDDADINRMYKEVEEKWTNKYHLLVATNKEPERIVRLSLSESLQSALFRAIRKFYSSYYRGETNPNHYNKRRNKNEN